ncbi:DddA-like double-stranded DNA deaminase toxin [Streptomyces althioticus]|uniref:DddA-like double-stranded DNA deaminase toxin n=1 Tax=Streptomyces althioticus TaxID=83380 RepID=UPI003872DFBF
MASLRKASQTAFRHEARTTPQRRGITNATVVINHRGGPCSGPLSCSVAVPAILPAGSTLTVMFPDGQGGMRSTPLQGRRR